MRPQLTGGRRTQKTVMNREKLREMRGQKSRRPHVSASQENGSICSLSVPAAVHVGDVSADASLGRIAFDELAECCLLIAVGKVAGMVACGAPAMHEKR